MIKANKHPEDRDVSKVGTWTSFRVFLGSHDRVRLEYREGVRKWERGTDWGVLKRRPPEFSDGWVIPISAMGIQVVLY